MPIEIQSVSAIHSYNTVEHTRTFSFIIKTSLVNKFCSSINFVGLRIKERAVPKSVGSPQMKGGT